MNSRSLAPIAFVIFTATASAAPHTSDICEGLDSAACLERMSVVMAGQQDESRAPAAKPRASRSDTAKAARPSLNLEQTLRAEGTN